MTALRVAIAGGGIGGLALAVALRQIGADVRLFERALALKEVGAGIQISPNGVRVLHALGMAGQFSDISSIATAVSLRDDTDGSEVARLDLQRYGGPVSYRFVHRHDLAVLLQTAALDAGVKIETGAEVIFARDRTLYLADGRKAEADLIIGADGLHSVLRHQLNSKAAAFFTGQVAWRAVVPNRMAHPLEARVHMGPGRHLVSYPLRQGRAVNIVAVQERSDWVAEGWSHRDDPQALRRAFAGAGETITTLLAEVEDVGLWGLFRHPVASVWAKEGMALLGDAAHPTLPFLAQGANMALEDAWILRRCLTELPDIDSALDRYTKLRRPRCERIVQTASGNARKYHLHRGPVRSAAHLGLRLAGRMAPSMMLRPYDWLYGYDATAIPIQG